MPVFMDAAQEARYDAAVRARIENNVRAKMFRRFHDEVVAKNTDLDWNAVERGNDFMRSLWLNGEKYGKLSEKQLAVIRNAQAKQRERVAENEAKRVALLNAGVAAPEGRTVVTGVIVSMKWIENEFGNCEKMLVQDDRGFKVWATVPTMYEKTDRGGFRSASVEVNERITFTATLTPSNDDVLFAFAKRPSKPSVEGRNIVARLPKTAE